jgi:ribonuclease HI
MSSELEVYIGFIDGASRHTQRLDSASWVIFSPFLQLMSFGGIVLGEETNKFSEYNAVIELLRDDLSHGISHLRVYLDSQLVVSQLKGVYHVYDPTLHQILLRVCILECYFDYITYIHVPRRSIQLTNTLANQVLDWHVSHT